MFVGFDCLLGVNDKDYRVNFSGSNFLLHKKTPLAKAQQERWRWLFGSREALILHSFFISLRRTGAAGRI